MSPSEFAQQSSPVDQGTDEKTAISNPNGKARIPGLREIADKASSWKHIVPLAISLLALFISALQMSNSNESASLTTYTQAAAYVLELDKAYLSNVELRAYFYENKALAETDPNRDRVLLLAETALDTLDTVVSVANDHRARISVSERDSELQWVTDAFNNSQVLRDYFDSHKSWYSDELAAVRDRAR